jgi:hypothetical protein
VIFLLVVNLLIDIQPTSGRSLLQYFTLPCLNTEDQGTATMANTPTHTVSEAHICYSYRLISVAPSSNGRNYPAQAQSGVGSDLVRPPPMQHGKSPPSFRPQCRRSPLQARRYRGHTEISRHLLRVAMVHEGLNPVGPRLTTVDPQGMPQDCLPMHSPGGFMLSSCEAIVHQYQPASNRAVKQYPHEEGVRRPPGRYRHLDQAPRHILTTDLQQAINL